VNRLKKMTFGVRLALADLAFACGLMSVLLMLGLRVAGGSDARGGYVTDLTTTGTSDFVAYLQETYGELDNALRTATYLHDRLIAKGNPMKHITAKDIRDFLAPSRRTAKRKRRTK
jgi:hypothetical protein